MWLMPIKEITDEVFDRSTVRITQADRRSLRIRSSYLAAVGEGRDLLFVLGLVPPTILSETAYLWMTFIGEPSFTRGQLRELRKFFPLFENETTKRLLAEAVGEREQKFLRFLGASFIENIGERSIYGWSK